MSDEIRESNISFRADKQADMLGLKKNKFGHTLSKNTEDNSPEEKVNLSFGSSGTGVVAHVDIFDSPHLKKFIENSDLDAMYADDEIEIDEIDLSEPGANLIEERPKTLEEFDMYADLIIKNPNQTKSKFAQPVDQKTLKQCSDCSTKIKADAKFCSNCGASQAMALFCKNCGNKFSMQEKFCCECGTKRE